MTATQPYPVLKVGAFGDAVLLLQRALNLGASQQPKLSEDKQFGPKTRNRVVEFQGQKKLAADGVVGPLTWAQLEPFIKQLMQVIDQVYNGSMDEAVLRKRIVDVAISSYETWGWGEKPVTPDGSPRIAAARGFGPAIGGRRARQGGAALGIIYGMASAGGGNCLTISTQIEQVYQWSAKEHPERRSRLNQEDIGSWCGIFTTYCLRAAGLKVTWNDVKHQSKQYFDIVLPNAPVKKGDIGVYDPMLNHHFLVVEDSDTGQRVHSIDGNVGNPLETTVVPWNSVIAKRFYNRATLMNKAGRFLRPKFAAMV
jgi:peptidoglycan hydrolase-like protein with peptidoglycan-binding domain